MKSRNIESPSKKRATLSLTRRIKFYRDHVQEDIYSGDASLGNNITGVSLAGHKKELEKEIRLVQMELEKEYDKGELRDEKEIEFLENILNLTQDRLKHIENDLPKTKTYLAEAMEALERQPSIPKEQLNEAETLLNQGKTEKAEALFQLALDHYLKFIAHPDKPLDQFKLQAADVAFQIGRLAENDFDYHKALDYFQSAAQLVPEKILYLENTGYLFFALGQYAKAVKYYEKALAIDLKNFGEDHLKVADRCFNLGFMYEFLEKNPTALQYYERALTTYLKFGLNHLVKDVKTYLDPLREYSVLKENE